MPAETESQDSHRADDSAACRSFCLPPARYFYSIGRVWQLFLAVFGLVALSGTAIVFGTVAGVRAQPVPPENLPTDNNRGLPPQPPQNSPSFEPIGPPQPLPALPPLEDIPGLTPQLEQIPPAPSETVPSETAPSETDRFFVRAFDIQGSTVFSPEDFARATANYVNRELAFSDLLEVRSTITQMYVDAGYVTSTALLPPQTLDSDIVRIQIIEGSLEDIQVRGTDRLHPNYIRNRLARADRIPLNTDRIIAVLQLLQLNPRIQSTSAELSAGTRPGQSVLTVEVTEANRVKVDVNLNTDRSPSIGIFERGIRLEDLNLFGQGDRFAVGFRNTDGSNIIESSYSYPFNAMEGTATIALSQNWADVIEEPFDTLDISAAATDWTVSFRQPIILEPTAEFALGITGFLRRARTVFTQDRIGFPLRGSGPDGRTRLSVLRFEQDGLWRDSRQVVAGRSEFSFGLDILDATSNPSGPDGQYFIWRGQLQWARALPASAVWVVRGNVQLADRELPPVEQFRLGGRTSVRGYRESLLLADNGTSFSTEIRIPLFDDRDGVGRFQIVPFADLGAGWNNGGLSVGRPNDALASTGLSLLWQQSDRLEARFTWGGALSGRKLYQQYPPRQRN